MYKNQLKSKYLRLEEWYDVTVYICIQITVMKASILWNFLKRVENQDLYPLDYVNSKVSSKLRPSTTLHYDTILKKEIFFYNCTCIML